MKNIIIEKNNSGKRIDKFLTTEFFSYTRGEIIRQIKAGNILVNGKKVKPSYVLKENDIIESKIKEQRAENEIVPNKKIKIAIIYQDENIIVVDKPAGMQVHPDFHEKINTLVNGIIAKFPEIKNVGDPSMGLGKANMRPGIVHRLDKDTSGVMVVARNQKTFEELKKKFKNREIEKKYWAIVYNGNLELGRSGKSGSLLGVINKPLARASSYRRQVVAGKKTKTVVREAVTEYQVIKEWDNFSLLEVTPKTGRMHQIRVHLASIGHPIVGDKIYGSKIIKKIENIKRPACNATRSIAGRQMLHAKDLAFELMGKNYKFEAELPDDFSKFLNLTK